VFDRRHASTARDAQSMIATRCACEFKISF
jgi:hypothetical protein